MSDSGIHEGNGTNGYSGSRRRGREHAIIWALAKSPKAGKIHCAPGNAGIAQLAECHPVAVNEFDKLKALAVELKVDLVVIGPDDPLADGLWMHLIPQAFRSLDRVAMQQRSKEAKHS